MARNVVDTSQSLASQSRLRMLLQGGNAADAAIAAAVAPTIVEPVSNGLGSNNFVIWRDGLKLRGLNSSGAPRRAVPCRGGLEPAIELAERGHGVARIVAA